MKKRNLALLVFGGIVLLFIIVTGYKTLAIKSKQPLPHSSNATINQDEAVQHLSKAITFKTVSY
ncbi:hypothetical protein [Neobacillus bataviensis]|uniref:hypothetical protein n=1 Tax=Neobacillus bataviensis TaxID=220685 RepID=UPI001CBCB723|nr:hypothetical protein [Neobacillus bataviensis]